MHAFLLVWKVELFQPLDKKKLQMFYSWKLINKWDETCAIFTKMESWAKGQEKDSRVEGTEAMDWAKSKWHGLRTSGRGPRRQRAEGRESRKWLSFYLFIIYLFFVSGAVAKLCKLLNIKVKNSRPYHPQSQGKVGRSHETWKRKLEFDTSQGNSTYNLF